jgi:uncharacterized protein
LLLAACVGLWLAGAITARAQPANLPPKPNQYVTDQAGVLDPGTVEALNSQLDSFERETSNQIVVAIYPSLPPDTDIAQYATYTYHAWQIGQKGKDNGALLLVGISDRKMFIATGRGLEGALPDATCKNIIDDQIAPRFRSGDYNGGVVAGVNSIIAASKGEYKGNGTTVYRHHHHADQGLPTWLVILIIIVIFIVIRRLGANGISGPMIYTGGGWGGGGGDWGGGGGGGGGDSGGFSGGGGDSGGGGAGGSW